MVEWVLYERENSAILNAALSQLSNQVVESFRQALRELGDFLFVIYQSERRDLDEIGFRQKIPPFSLLLPDRLTVYGEPHCYPGVEDAIVIDIGGTTCDVGVLQNRFPRESFIDLHIDGIRTNFRMPDILSIALGGGTIIHNAQELLHQDNPDTCTIDIGPESVGFQLTKKALIFGGDTLTATDIAAVTNTKLDIGNRQHIQHIPLNLAITIEEKMHSLYETALDRMKTSVGDMPVILVGGGHILIKRHLAGCSELIRPKYASVANAIGASIAQVGGEIDRIYSYQELSREQALADARQSTTNRVIQAGGDQDTLRFIDFDETELNYLPGKAVRVSVKAVANLTSETSLQ